MTTKNKKKNTTTASTTTTSTSAKKRLGARKAPSTATAPPAAPAPAAVAGDTTATPADLGSIVGDITSFLDTVEPKLGPEPTVTTSTQKRRVSKPRKGADKVLPVIAAIVQQHGLDSPSLSSTTVMDAYTTAQTLVPLQTRLQKMAKRVSDTAFGAQTDAWGMGLQLYSMLKRRAKTDGQVAEQIAPLAHVFSYRHPLVKAQKPTKRETQVKAEVKHVTALAEKHGVPFGPSANAGSSGASTSSGPASAGASAGGAAQVQSAPLGSMAPPVGTVATVGSSGAQVPVTAQAPVAAQATVASTAPVVAQAPVVGASAAPVQAASGSAATPAQGAAAGSAGSTAAPSGQGVTVVNGAASNGAGSNGVAGH